MFDFIKLCAKGREALLNEAEQFREIERECYVIIILVAFVNVGVVLSS